MSGRIGRLVAIAALVLTGTVAIPAAAVQIGTGGWTKITTPAKTFTYHFDGSEGAVNQLTISGKASPDVPTVNIYCGVTSHRALNGQYVASNVQVTNGTFTTTATIPAAVPVCRLMALPGALPDVGYLGAFTGPLMYTYTFGKPADPDTGKPVTFAATTGFGSGAAGVTDPTLCGVLAMSTVELVDVQVRGPATPMCTLSLLPGDINGVDSTASSVQVDGKDAYLPAAIFGLRQPSGGGLTLPQPSITVTFNRNSSTGDLSITDTAHFWRCSGGDGSFPPSAASCPTIVDTGVTFKRVLQITRGNHQVVVHDSFSSNNGHAHTVNAQYSNKFARPNYGAPGFTYPKHAGAFHESTYDQVVTGFGTGPATVLVRSDRYASSTDPDTDTQALTWSRPPARIRFSHNNTSAFSLPYTFHVLSSGATKIAFAMSEAPLTADAKALAAKAAAAF